MHIFLSFRIFEQLVLALKNRAAPKFFTVLKYFFKLGSSSPPPRTPML